MRTDAPARAGENAAPEVKKRLDAIRARLAAATPWPWVAEHGAEGFLVTDANDMIVADLHRTEDGDPHDVADLDLIANAPTDLAYLLALVDTLAAAVVLVDSALSDQG